MIKGWKYSKKRGDFHELDKIRNIDDNYGFVYAARIDVCQGFRLIKIGATRTPQARLQCFGAKASLFCVSPPHRNFWENEEILHEFFRKYRVPARPGKSIQSEFFNMSIPYFIDHLPSLTYE